MNKPILLLDFDDTLHYYHPREFSAHLGPPIAKARSACHILKRHFRLICFTSRPPEMVERWLRSNGFPQMMVTNMKQPGLILDDRAVTFGGEWTDELIQYLVNFEPYWMSDSARPESQVQEVVGHQSTEETDDGDGTTPVSDSSLDET